MSAPQSFTNHRRWDPAYHFFLVPLFLLGLLAAVIYFFWRPNLLHGLAVLATSAFFVMSLRVRSFPLRAQDRLIRLEETLRMERILPEDLKGRIPELTVKQFVGLRFAADAELAHRVREALEEHLDGEAIKKRIQTWRPDPYRV